MVILLNDGESRLWEMNVVNQSMKNKVCLVTGASQGIGRHFALVLARAGAIVVATSLASENECIF